MEIDRQLSTHDQSGLPVKRLGRGIIRVHQHSDLIASPVARAELGTLLRAGQAMDFAARLREQGERLTPGLAFQFANLSGISAADLRLIVLPTLHSAGVVTYSYKDAALEAIEDYVGVTRPFLHQVVEVANQLGPSDVEWCLLHSIELAAWAPLTERQHLEQLITLGFTEEIATRAIALALSAGLNQRVRSDALREEVVYNAYVWGTSAVNIAAFFRSMPTSERDVILGICEEATARPALAVPQMAAFDPRVVNSARKVGLIQAATVVSTNRPNLRQTYIFSPLQELEDNTRRTTEALHERKLFVAHILFGHEKATWEGGRIRDPVILVDALLRRGQVGPADNIASDYHLLEAAGIIRVEQTRRGPIMKLVKSDIVEDGFRLLERTLGSAGASARSATPLNELRPPGMFISPEKDRRQVGEDAASMELMHSAVLRLRKEAESAARHDNPFE